MPSNQSKSRYLLTSVLLLLLTSGCNPVPTPGEIQVTSLTASVTPALTSTLSATTSTVTIFPTTAITSLPPIVVEQPTTIPTPMTEAGPEGLPVYPALIQISKPGRLSRVASPLVVSVQVYPGDGGEVLVQLIGEDGRLMYEKLMVLEIPESGWVQFGLQIPFEIPSAGERALLAISTRDGYGRRLAQAGLPLILLQIGDSEIELPGFQKQPFLLVKPAYSAVATKGVVHIEGYAHLYDTKRIVGELVTQTGGIMQSAVIYVRVQDSEQEYVPFSMDIPYNVDVRTPVRLTLRQADETQLGVDIILQSLPIYLDP